MNKEKIENSTFYKAITRHKVCSETFILKYTHSFTSLSDSVPVL